ncbi:MAG: ABC transporter ATP-binding protein [Christensenellales bacterium]
MDLQSQRKRFQGGRLRIFASYYKPHLPLFILDMTCAFFIAGIDLAFPMLTRYALQTLMPNLMYAAFFRMVLWMVLGYLLRSVMQFIVAYWGHLLGVRMEADMRHDLFAQLQRQSFTFFDQIRTGHLMSRVTNDLFEITELAHHGPEDLFISLVTLTGAFVALFFVQWKLALILLILVPLVIGFTIFQRKFMTRSSREVKKKTAGINAEIESSISGVRVSKAFANEAFEAEKFENANNRYRGAKNKFYLAMAVFHSGLEFAIVLMNVLVIGVGGYFIMQGEMDYVGLMTFTLYVNSFLAPIRRIGAFMESYEGGMAGFERFVELMRMEPDIKDAPDAVPLKDVQGDIRFEHVDFSYNGSGTNVLRDVNLHIPAGKTVALVGPSGGGKSTLCQLIPRFYDVNRGEILFDGLDIKHIQLSSLRQNIGIVQQDVFLFASTIRENIRYGNMTASDEEVERAAKLADIHDFIMTLPDGYDSNVGERGVLLSGGQKQRIAIARIFLKNPRVLILDEATSALDSTTEARIQQALDRLAHGRTCLIIAHRLSTIQNADEIIVIDEEGIRERGTHEALMAQHGIYEELYRIQFQQQH